MKQRMRKLLGTVVLVTFVTIYSFVAMVLASVVLPGESGFAAFAYYAIAGVLWALPAALLIRWMQRPDARET